MDSARHAANEDVGRTDQGVALINDAGLSIFFSSSSSLTYFLLTLRTGRDEYDRDKKNRLSFIFNNIPIFFNLVRSDSRVLTGVNNYRSPIRRGSRHKFERGWEAAFELSAHLSRKWAQNLWPGPTRARNHYLDSGRDIYTYDLRSPPHPVITYSRSKTGEKHAFVFLNHLRLEIA